MMKKLLLWFTLSPFASFAQRPTVPELIKLTACKELTCFTDFASSREFCFLRKEGFYLYSSCKFIADGPDDINTKDQLSYNPPYKSISLTTASNSYYITLLNGLKSAGFVQSSVDNSDDRSLEISYKSARYPKIELTMKTSNVEKAGVGKWTLWSLTLYERL